MNLKKEDKGYVVISYENLNEKGETDKLYSIRGQLPIEEYFRICEENFPGCLMHFAKSLHNKNLTDVSQEKINVQSVKSKKDTKESKTKNKDGYAEHLRARNEAKKLGTVSPQPNHNEDLKDMQAKAKVQEALELFNCFLNKKAEKDNKEQPESKKRLPMVGFGIIGENITDKEIEDLMGFLSETGLLEFLPDKLMKEDDKLEFKPMDCDHKCFSCKSLGTCETIKRAMDKAKNTPIQ